MLSLLLNGLKRRKSFSESSNKTAEASTEAPAKTIPREKPVKQLAYLRVKIKSLANEATIIRQEERKTLGKRDYHRDRQKPVDIVNYFDGIYIGLHHHRTYDVRNEARSAQLAYAYLRGKTYKETENAKHSQPNANRIAEIVRKFGLPGPLGAVTDSVEEWIKA